MLVFLKKVLTFFVPLVPLPPVPLPPSGDRGKGDRGKGERKKRSFFTFSFPPFPPKGEKATPLLCKKKPKGEGGQGDKKAKAGGCFARGTGGEQRDGGKGGWRRGKKNNGISKKEGSKNIYIFLESSFLYKKNVFQIKLKIKFIFYFNQIYLK